MDAFRIINLSMQNYAEEVNNNNNIIRGQRESRTESEPIYVLLRWDKIGPNWRIIPIALFLSSKRPSWEEEEVYVLWRNKWKIQSGYEYFMVSQRDMKEKIETNYF